MKLNKSLLWALSISTIFTTPSWADSAQPVMHSANSMHHMHDHKDHMMKSDPKIVTTMNPGPKFTMDDGKYVFFLTGFAQIDGEYISHDKSYVAATNAQTGVVTPAKVNYRNSSRLKNMRIAAGGVLDYDWNFFLDAQFFHTSIDVQETSIAYIGLKDTKITAGYMGQPFSLESKNSIMHTAFLERPMFTSIIPGSNNMGIMVEHRPQHHYIGIGVFGSDSIFHGTQGQANSGNQIKQVTGRAIFRPVNDPGKLVHVGGSGYVMTPDKQTRTATYTATPNTSMNVNYLATPTLTNVKNVKTFGAEIALIEGPLTFQAEYIQNKTNTRGTNKYKFTGGNAQIAYVLTGEHRNYNNNLATVTSPMPDKNFSMKEGGMGAWEVAYRYDFLNFNKNPLSFGKMTTNTFGINWYPNKNVKIMNDFTWVKTDSNAAIPNNKPFIYMARAQISF